MSVHSIMLGRLLLAKTSFLTEPRSVTITCQSSSPTYMRAAPGSASSSPGRPMAITGPTLSDGHPGGPEEYRCECEPHRCLERIAMRQCRVYGNTIRCRVDPSPRGIHLPRPLSRLAFEPPPEAS